MSDEPPQLDHAARALLEVATSAASQQEFRREALRWIDHHVGFDSALLGEAKPVGDADGPEIVGFDAAFLARFAAAPARYAPALAGIMSASMEVAAPVRDVDVYSSSQRARMPFYNEVIGPKGSRVMLVATLVIAGTPRGSLQISRNARGTTFRDRELAIVRTIQPILALGDGLHRPHAVSAATVAPAAPRAPVDDLPRLSPRERDVLEYLSLGLTNAEIALACGTSINTVRNQVASLLRKVGAASRTELVALALGAGLIAPRGG